MCGMCHYCTIGRPALCEVGAKTLYTLPTGDLRTKDAAGAPTEHLLRLRRDGRVRDGVDAQPDPDSARCAAATGGAGRLWRDDRLLRGDQHRAGRAGRECRGIRLRRRRAVGDPGRRGVGRRDDRRGRHRRFQAGARAGHGRTHAVNSKGEENLVKALKKLTGGGVDYAFECVGNGALVATAYGALRKGGKAIVVGVAPPKDMTTIRTASLTFEEKSAGRQLFRLGAPARRCAADPGAVQGGQGEAGLN
jgi:S-(hydroxymethyl)glutathione dehydrogenase/alcohol dehydrogenase